ncbi:hypothetical protein MTR67_022276 [Solanum verrucosum]|uniref:MADS-box domain-containing protein n=1 Tax=Solanum verrucosum TaxID=315347 RepID=A0AAF0QT51_SOLVR|nr:hypothetical protein MTR67_022276 [Solanum verrucosum]
MEKKMKGNMLNYKKKKETIEKKTRELSILCDIKACVILVDPNGEVDTWPENPIDFNPIIQSYKENLNHGKRKRIDDDGCFNKNQKRIMLCFAMMVKISGLMTCLERRTKVCW